MFIAHAPDVGGDLVHNVHLSLLVIADLDFEVDEGQAHGGQLLFQDFADLDQDTQGLVILTGLEHVLHDAQTLSDEGIALLVVLQSNFGVRGIEHDALRQSKAAAHGTGSEVTQHELQLGYGQLADLHKTLLHVGA